MIVYDINTWTLNVYVNVKGQRSVWTILSTIINCRFRPTRVEQNLQKKKKKAKSINVNGQFFDWRLHPSDQNMQLKVELLSLGFLHQVSLLQSLRAWQNVRFYYRDISQSQRSIPGGFRVFVSSERHRMPTRPTGRLVPQPRSCFSTVKTNEKPGASGSLSLRVTALAPSVPAPLSRTGSPSCQSQSLHSGCSLSHPLPGNICCD